MLVPVQRHGQHHPVDQSRLPTRFGIYNFVRRHHSLGTTPAVAAGIEGEPLEFRTSCGDDGNLPAAEIAKAKAANAFRRRIEEDAVF